MGSLKDQKSNLPEDRDTAVLPGTPDMTEPRVCMDSTDINPTPEGLHINTSHQPTSQDCPVELPMNTGHGVEGAEAAEFSEHRDTAFSAVECSSVVVQLDSMPVEDKSQRNTVPVIEQPGAESASEVKHATIQDDTKEKNSAESQPVVNVLPESDLSHTGGGGQIRREHSEEKGTKEGRATEEEREEKEEREKEEEREKKEWRESVNQCTEPPPPPVLPPRQQHIQTQVSLEVVQSHSVATSPMTPPEGAAAAFLFPCSGGRQVEFRSVATAPMTPKTPTAANFAEVEYRSVATGPMTPKTPTAPNFEDMEYRSIATGPMTPKTPTTLDFPEISRGERERTEERMEEERMKERTEGEQTEHVQQECGDDERETATQSESDPAVVYPHLDLAPACTIPKEEIKEPDSDSNVSPDTSIKCPQIKWVDSEGYSYMPDEEPMTDKQQYTQYGSKVEAGDQEITILVTHHDSAEDEEEEEEQKEGREETESSIHSTEPVMLKSDECEELSDNARAVLEHSIEVSSAGDDALPIQENSMDGGHSDPAQQDQETTPTNSNSSQQNKKEDSLFASENVQPETDLMTSQSPSQNKHPDQSGDEDTETKPCFSNEVRESVRLKQTELSPLQPTLPLASPAKQQHIQTQVSLEVVQYHSVATSPMTPPEGAVAAFLFPGSSGTLGHGGGETTDAEMQVGRQVEFRSIATAPMTPQTPTAPDFPEVKYCSVGTAPMTPKTPTAPDFPEISGGEREQMEERKGEERMKERMEEEKEERPERKEEKTPEKMTAEKKEEIMTENKTEKRLEERETEEKMEEKTDEEVKEVRWDEKGMTWEVYGAVVEVAVLGSAIQKHLEKQVKKHRKHPSLPPPPPLSLTAAPFPSTPPPTSGSSQGGSGKGCAGKRGEREGKRGRRSRNPFRLLMQNVQQPNCCSRAHTTE